MLPRLTAVIIIIFWATMWALLIRTEVRPLGAVLREVPVEHVVKLMFRHGQPSDLYIQGENTRLGSVRLHPHISKENGQRLLELTGSFEARAPGATLQRVTWDGALAMSSDLELEMFRLGTMVQDPAAPRAPQERFELTVQPRERRALWQWHSYGRLLDERTYTLDEAGLGKALGDLSLNPALVRSVPISQATPPRITAHLSSLRIRDEWAETYLIRIEHGGQTWLECHVSQLGQVLHARTLPGWTLSP
jgi:hypothetical protein